MINVVLGKDEIPQDVIERASETLMRLLAEQNGFTVDGVTVVKKDEKEKPA